MLKMESILKRLEKQEEIRLPREIPWIFASVESLDREVGLICLVSPKRERFSLDRLPGESDALWDARKQHWMKGLRDDAKKQA